MPQANEREALEILVATTYLQVDSRLVAAICEDSNLNVSSVGMGKPRSQQGIISSPLLLFSSADELWPHLVASSMQTFSLCPVATYGTA